MIPSGGGVDSLRAFVQSPDFQNLPTAVQQQILDRLGPAATGLIPSPGGGMIPPPPREPPVIRIPGGEPDVPPGGRLPPPDAPARLPGPEPDAPPPKRRGPWEALGLLGLGGLAAFWPGDDPNLDGAATPLKVEPAAGKPLGADALGAQNAPRGGLISPSHRARINYWAERTGTPVATVAGMFAANPDKALVDLNMMSSQQYQDRNRAARDRWQATAMLAGGSHNINSGNRGAYNILNELKGKDRERALLYMTPAGPLAAGVDARSADRAAAMAQQAMTAFLANNPGADPESRKRAEDMIMREKNPAMAGANDIAGRNFESPQAQDEFERLAESIDTTWGGFSYDDERRLAAALMKPPYNMSQPDAEAMAYRYAEKLRWVSGRAPGGRGALPPAPADAGADVGDLPTTGW
jgi:hypothetical protein